MAEIKFYANINIEPPSNTLIDHTAGSGLGFYGSDYGVSVPIGDRQGTTWMTNSTGTEATLQKQLHNTKLLTEGSTSTKGTVSVNGVTRSLNELPNYLTPLNIRFTHTEAVRVQNCSLKIFDRSDVTTHADGVVTYVYEVRHPSNLITSDNLSHRAGKTAGGGTDDDMWIDYDSMKEASPPAMPFTDSPGVSGFMSNDDDTGSSNKWNAGDQPSPLVGSMHNSLQHDWYVAISAEPTSIGSKTDYGLYFTLEYL